MYFLDREVFKKMVVVINIGRRIPRKWFKRQASKVRGLMSFQENIWQIIKSSMSMGMRKCNASGKGKWIQTKDNEVEDLHYEIEWIKILIEGNREFEKEEYEDALNLYKSFGNIFKKELDIPENNPFKKQLKSKVLSQGKINEAYKKGYGSVSDNNISNKLLEMGILTHIEWIDDFDGRKEVFISRR